MIVVNKWGLRNIDEYGFLEKAVTVSKVGSRERERDLAQINIQETKAAIACWLLFFFFFFYFDF